MGSTMCSATTIVGCQGAAAISAAAAARGLAQIHPLKQILHFIMFHS